MKKSLIRWQVLGFIFTGIAGTLLHFAYDWSGQSVIFAPISAVNESIWEHMKLLFFPLFVFALTESRFLVKNHYDFWCAKLAGTTVGLLLIPMLYYTYTGALGVSADWFNITIFFLAAAATFWFETRLLNQQTMSCRSQLTAFIVLCLIGAAFVVLTFIQPKIPLFQDPVTGLYGIFQIS